MSHVKRPPDSYGELQVEITTLSMGISIQIVGFHGNLHVEHKDFMGNHPLES